MKYFCRSHSCITGSRPSGPLSSSRLCIITSTSPGRAWKTSARISLAVSRLLGPAYHRPGLDRLCLPLPGPPHEYASSVLWAPGVFASAFAIRPLACSRQMQNTQVSLLGDLLQVRVTCWRVEQDDRFPRLEGLGNAPNLILNP